MADIAGAKNKCGWMKDVFRHKAGRRVANKVFIAGEIYPLASAASVSPVNAVMMPIRGRACRGAAGTARRLIFVQ